ncbi:hypothetical protein CMT92_07335 [Elizabethkingia anophelis]|uniref:hypothetical protein n=1 Tax=Elizabethkingia anophelis TaxID=1117645 RepID=UPI0021A4927A|nr:hypothetical protein [Elizabethkingia anophelis]MCT3871768.1 hypothetical protein [Elizabethkingia anophelis]MDV3847464.1 hypothetical protein [Elizabethkingia anophelis]
MINTNNILNNIKDLNYLKDTLSDFKLSIAERIHQLDYDNFYVNYHIAKFIKLITAIEEISDNDLIIYIDSFCSKLGKGFPEIIIEKYRTI